MTGEDHGSEKAREVRIPNELGLHARPAAAFVKLSSRYECEIYIAKGDLEVNGKSIMGVMMLAAECGCTVVVRATGPDEAEAVEALVRLIDTGFGER